MAAVKDPYKTLGVDKKSSDEDIKKAYRKLAREYHPDPNHGDKDAEERFKEVQEAYSILSDPEKRKAYDSGGGIFGGGFDPGSFRTGAPGGGFGGGFGDILSDLFGNAGGRGGGGRPPRPERGRDLETEIQISFEQAMEGAQMPVSVPLSAPCADLPRHRRQARHPAHDLHPLPGPRRGGGVTGAVLDLPALPALRRHGHGDQGSLPHLQGQRAHPPGQALSGEHPGRGQGGQPRAAGRQGRGRAARRGHRRPLRSHARRRLPDLRAQRRQSRSGGPDHDPRGHPRGHDRGADARGSKRIRVPPGTQHGTVQRLSGRGPARSSRARAAATSTTGSRSTYRARSPRSSRRSSTSWPR